MVRIRYADQKLLCLQWKCGLGLEMALSVDARRGSAPCRWAFPGVLFIIKKCWNEILVILKKNNINHQNHSNNAKKQKNFQMTKHLHRDLSTTNQKNRPFGLLLPEAESVCSTESVGQPINSTRRCAVFVAPRATDTAYRLNYHIIWTQAVVIRLCEVIRPAHCLTLLSPQRLILIP